MHLIQKPKKSLGQNFLIDKNIINKILKVENIEKNQTILEIGSGYGNLTEKIVQTQAKKIIAIEKDKKIANFLKDKFAKFKHVEIINEDIFEVIEKKIFGGNIIVFGNLPYNISTQVLSKLVMIKKWPPWYKTLVLMFQEEVADRIISKKKSDYGRLSILCNWRLNIKRLFNVSKNSFYPRPKINSTVLSFKPKENFKYLIKNPKNLETVTRILFSSRRKMINKNFLKLFKGNISIAKDLNLNLNLRPEEIDKEMFYKIAMKYEEIN